MFCDSKTAPQVFERLLDNAPLCGPGPLHKRQGFTRESSAMVRGKDQGSKNKSEMRSNFIWALTLVRDRIRTAVN